MYILPAEICREILTLIKIMKCKLCTKETAIFICDSCQSNIEAAVKTCPIIKEDPIVFSVHEIDISKLPVEIRKMVSPYNIITEIPKRRDTLPAIIALAEALNSLIDKAMATKKQKEDLVTKVKQSMDSRYNRILKNHKGEIN